jgi:hypothetical protein
MFCRHIVFVKLYSITLTIQETEGRKYLPRDQQAASWASLV